MLPPLLSLVFYATPGYFKRQMLSVFQTRTVYSIPLLIYIVQNQQEPEGGKGMAFRFCNGKGYRSRLLAYAMAFSTVIITIAMTQYPKAAFDSAVMGLNLWWNVVFPSLLPFFILSEILMGVGVVHFIGVLLEPFMRPLFNVPGVGAFALSMGLASGYPMDAVITSNFRKSRLCSAVEAERLLSFTNTADPLFMFGAVAVGMFGMPELGASLAIAHYLSSFLVGFIFRYHGRTRDHQITDSGNEGAGQGNIMVRALRALYRAKIQDGRSFGQLLGDSVKNSMQTILLIGGFIILFSVFLQILQSMGVTSILTIAASYILQAIHYDLDLAPAIISGLFEIDLGTLAAAQADAPLVQKVAVAGAIIAWSGLSVHGQVASIVIESGIRMTPYIFGRLLHAVFAGIFTVLFLGPAQPVVKQVAVPVFLNTTGTHTLPFWLERFTYLTYQMGLFLAILITLSMLYYLYRSISQGFQHLFHRK
jgi:sporulation integral membrane protein YlbJ